MKANQYDNGSAAAPREKLFAPILCPPRRDSHGAVPGETAGSGGDPISPGASVGVWVVFAGFIWGAFAVLSPVLGELPF